MQLHKILAVICLLNILVQNTSYTITKPRVSIITSVYKGDEFIEGFLNDIVRQTIFDQCELIIINANSPGNEEPIIKKFCTTYPNIIYERLSTDPGLYGVWNYAIKKARADLITNANIDDRRNPKFIEIHANALEQDHTIDLVYSDYYISTTPNEPFEKNNYSSYVTAAEFAPTRMNLCLPGPCPMWRKSLHDSVGFFDETFFIAGDFEFWNRIVAQGAQLKKIPGYSCLFYQNPQGLSNLKNAAKIKQHHLENDAIIQKYKHVWYPPKRYNEKFSLIINLYNETNISRMSEYICCLEKNVAHNCIDAIHVLYDTTKDDNKNYLLHYLQSKKIGITYIKECPTYGTCFELANTLFPNKRIIVSNADIYFNETLSLLHNHSLENKFLALTRWNVLSDGRLEIFKQYHNGEFQKLWSETSQDVWIFQTPLKKFVNDSIHLGTMQCDSLIAYQAHISGLTVINPCLSIQCCHLDLTGIRNYNSDIRSEGTWMPVPWQKL